MSTQSTEVLPAHSDASRATAAPRARESTRPVVAPPPPVWAGLGSPRRLLGQIGVVMALLLVGGVVAWSMQGSGGEGVELVAGQGPSTTSPSNSLSESLARRAGEATGVGHPPEGKAAATSTPAESVAPSAGATVESVEPVLPSSTKAETPAASDQPRSDQAMSDQSTSGESGSTQPAVKPQTGTDVEPSGSAGDPADGPARAKRTASQTPGSQTPGSQPAAPEPTAPKATTTTTVSSTTATTAATTTTRPEPAGGGGGAQSGTLLFEDNFNSLNRSTWAVEHSTYGDGNNELQCYRPENVSVAGGKLILRAKTETYTCPGGSTRQVTSGMVRSRGVTFAPGQAIEFRVKLTPNNESDQGGLWPAVWSSGFGSGGWPRSGEIDFLEVMTANNPKRSVYSIHYAKPGGGHGVTNKPVVGANNFSAQWHVVRFEYGLNGRLVWFLDGRQVHSVDSVTTLQGYPSPFDLPIREIKVNLALGGRPGPLAAGAVGSGGATFEMDYLRIYSL